MLRRHTFIGRTGRVYGDWDDSMGRMAASLETGIHAINVLERNG